MLISASHHRIITFRAAFAAATAMGTIASAQATTQSTSKGTPAVTTHEASGTVIQAEGDQLLVKLTSGEVRVFTPPADTKFVIDGKETKLSDIQPGTKLHATVTETKTPVMDRTVQTISGKVFYVAAPTVILRLPSGETRQFVVKDTVKFHRPDGGDMTVFDLRKDMNVTAEKVTEAPRVELSTTRNVTGTGPVQHAAAPAPKASAPAPARMAAAAPEAAPAAAAPAAPHSMPAPAHLPKTGSPVPLIGLLGLLLTVGALGVRRYRLQ